MRAFFSLSSSLGVVPDEISAWNPDTAPQAMVMKMNGNKLPDQAGPVPSTNWVTAGMRRLGATNTMAKARPTMVPIFKKVDR